MNGELQQEDEPMAAMNFIPLIDIALTLVVILMVTTVFVRAPGVNLKLPETATREGAPETNKDLTLVVSAKGDILVDGRPQNETAIKARLKSVAARDKNARVLVKGDRQVLYKRMMEVMDMVRQSGLSRVVLPTDPKTDVVN